MCKDHFAFSPEYGLVVPFPHCVLHQAQSASADFIRAVQINWYLGTHRKAGKRLLAPGRLPGNHATDLFRTKNASTQRNTIT